MAGIALLGRSERGHLLGAALAAQLPALAVPCALEPHTTVHGARSHRSHARMMLDVIEVPQKPTHRQTAIVNGIHLGTPWSLTFPSLTSHPITYSLGSDPLARTGIRS